MEIKSEKNPYYRCHFAQLFTLISEGIKQWTGEGVVLQNSETVFSETSVTLSRLPHAGVAGIYHMLGSERCFCCILASGRIH